MIPKISVSLQSRASRGKIRPVNRDINNVAICGLGSFGYALLNHLDTKGSDGIRVSAYDRNQELVNYLSDNRHHPVSHPSVNISSSIDFAASIEALARGCDVLILAVSSDATRDVIKAVRPHISHDTIIVNTAKALDFQTGRRLSEIVREELGGEDHAYALMAGGTIADDLFKQQPLGIDIASENKDVLPVLAKILESSNLHIYTTDDLVGVEYASAFKNIIAILAGIVKGLGFSFGAETHVISSTAQLMGEAAVHDLGAKPETFSMGRQCWGNDLWMSCTGNTRNREFGVLIGKGMPLDEVLALMKSQHKTVEGFNTLQVLDKISPVKEIAQVALLYELIVKKSIGVADIKNFLLRTHMKVTS